jgi:hypothetical protein
MRMNQAKLRARYAPFRSGWFGVWWIFMAIGLSPGPLHAAPSGCASTYSGIKLTRYAGDDPGNPILAKHGVIVDPAVLEAFAREYANCPRVSTRNQFGIHEPNPSEFFVLWLPNRLYEMVTGDLPPPAGAESMDLMTEAGAGRALWLIHLAGYYSGIWLDRVQDASYGSTEPNDNQPGNPNTTNDNLDNAYLLSVEDAFQVAFGGTDDEVLAFNRASLRTDPTRVNTGYVDINTGIAQLLPIGNNPGHFGYDIAYLDAILPPSASAPPGAAPFADPYVTFDMTKLLDATYALPELTFLKNARASLLAAENGSAEAQLRLADAINGGVGEQPLLSQQLEYFALSEGLYRGPLSTGYMSFPLDHYDILLGWGTYISMTNQALSYQALSAYATRNVDLGRRLAIETALWSTYVTLYALGVTGDNTPNVTLDNAMPCFMKAGGTCARSGSGSGPGGTPAPGNGVQGSGGGGGGGATGAWTLCVLIGLALARTLARRRLRFDHSGPDGASRSGRALMQR